jgi:hypothetical protein
MDVGLLHDPNSLVGIFFTGVRVSRREPERHNERLCCKQQDCNAHTYWPLASEIGIDGVRVLL